MKTAASALSLSSLRRWPRALAASAFAVGVVSLIASPLVAQDPAATSSDTKTSASSSTSPQDNVTLTNAPPLPAELRSESNAPAKPETPAAAAKPEEKEKPAPAANPEMTKSGLGEEVDRNVKTQIFLDQQNFGPGYIDGHTGEFTKMAISRYKEAKKLPADGPLDPALMEGVTEIYTTYTIVDEDQKHVGATAGTVEEKSKLDKLLYTSLAELISEKYHTDPKFLHELNKGVDIDKLTVGQTVKVPNVQPFQLADLKRTKEETSADKTSAKKKKKPDSDVAAAAEGQRITIDRKKRVLELREGDQLAASFPVTVGEGTIETPLGDWKVQSIEFNPTFRWDEGMLNKGKRTDKYYMLPPGPNNPVGVVWIGLNKEGIGIHGTSDPKGIGRSVSHGCVRLSNWDVLKLVHMVHKGTPVTVMD